MQNPSFLTPEAIALRKDRIVALVAHAESQPPPRKPTLAELKAQVAKRSQLRAALGQDDGATRPRRKPTLAELRAKFRQPADVPGHGEVPLAARSEGIANEVVLPAASQTARRPDLQEIRRKFLQSEPAQTEPADAPKSYKRTRLQEAAAEWLGDVEWNLMVTFTFKGKHGASLPLATKIYGQFIPRLREIVLRKGSTRRIPMAAVVENSREQLQNVGLPVDGREGTHIHVLLQVRGEDPYKYKDAIEKAWKTTNRRCGDPTVYCPDSSEWYLPLTSDAMRKGYTGYILKHHGADTLGLLIPYLHLD